MQTGPRKTCVSGRDGRLSPRPLRTVVTLGPLIRLLIGRLAVVTAADSDGIQIAYVLDAPCREAKAPLSKSGTKWGL